MKWSDGNFFLKNKQTIKSAMVVRLCCPGTLWVETAANNDSETKFKPAVGKISL